MAEKVLRSGGGFVGPAAAAAGRDGEQQRAGAVHRVFVRQQRQVR